MLNGLSADARAFVGTGPTSLSAHEMERARFREHFLDYQADLTERVRGVPAGRRMRYSPLSFFFNFSHNVVKGQVVDSLLWSAPWAIALNDLFTGAVAARRTANARARPLARTLIAYARTNPHKIRGRLMPVIVYDPDAGYRGFRLTLRRLRE